MIRRGLFMKKLFLISIIVSLVLFTGGANEELSVRLGGFELNNRQWNRLYFSVSHGGQSVGELKKGDVELKINGSLYTRRLKLVPVKKVKAAVDYSFLIETGVYIDSVYLVKQLEGYRYLIDSAGKSDSFTIYTTSRGGIPLVDEVGREGALAALHEIEVAEPEEGTPIIYEALKSIHDRQGGRQDGRRNVAVISGNLRSVGEAVDYSELYDLYDWGNIQLFYVHFITFFIAESQVIDRLCKSSGGTVFYPGRNVDAIPVHFNYIKRFIDNYYLLEFRSTQGSDIVELELFLISRGLKGKSLQNFEVGYAERERQFRLEIERMIRGESPEGEGDQE